MPVSLPCSINQSLDAYRCEPYTPEPLLSWSTAAVGPTVLFWCSDRLFRSTVLAAISTDRYSDRLLYCRCCHHYFRCSAVTWLLLTVLSLLSALLSKVLLLNVLLPTSRTKSFVMGLLLFGCYITGCFIHFTCCILPRLGIYFYFFYYYYYCCYYFLFIAILITSDRKMGYYGVVLYKGYKVAFLVSCILSRVYLLLPFSCSYYSFLFIIPFGIER